MSCAKTDEPIKMPFKMWTETGPENHGLGRKGDFEGFRRPLFGLQCFDAVGWAARRASCL